MLLTENMFGDILSDEAAMIAGSIGAARRLGRAWARGGPRSLRARARLGARHRRAQGVANPLATFGSVALMLRHSLGMEDAAAAVESAIDRVLERGLRTPDLADGAPEESRGRDRRDDRGGDRGAAGAGRGAE